MSANLRLSSDVTVEGSKVPKEPGVIVPGVPCPVCSAAVRTARTLASGFFLRCTSPSCARDFELRYFGRLRSPLEQAVDPGTTPSPSEGQEEPMQMAAK